jgi:hypothetical protein
MSSKVLLTSLSALVFALSVGTSTGVMAASNGNGNSNAQTASNNNNGSSLQGCGNSGKPGCPPKQCPPGHGGTNPAGHQTCQKQTSGS